MMKTRYLITNFIRKEETTSIRVEIRVKKDKLNTLIYYKLSIL